MNLLSLGTLHQIEDVSSHILPMILSIHLPHRRQKCNYTRKATLVHTQARQVEGNEHTPFLSNIKSTYHMGDRIVTRRKATLLGNQQDKRMSAHTIQPIHLPHRRLKYDCNESYFTTMRSPFHQLAAV